MDAGALEKLAYGCYPKKRCTIKPHPFRGRVTQFLPYPTPYAMHAFFPFYPEVMGSNNEGPKNFHIKIEMRNLKEKIMFLQIDLPYISVSHK